MATTFSVFSSVHGKTRPIMLPDGDVLVNPPRILEHLKYRLLRTKSDQMYPGHHRRVDSASGAREVLSQSIPFDPTSEYDREAVVLLSDWVGKPHPVDMATRNSYRRKIVPQPRRPKTQSLTFAESSERQSIPVETIASLTVSMKAATDLAKFRRSSIRVEQGSFAERVKREENSLRTKVESALKEIADRQRAIISAKAEIAGLREVLAKTQTEYSCKDAGLQEELGRIVVDKDTVQTDPQAFIRKAWIKEEIAEAKQVFDLQSNAQQQAISEAALRLFSLTSQMHVLRRALSDSRRVMLDFYYKTLREGTVCREKGLRWVVEAIWAMNEPVPLSTFPKFLDKEGIQHVLDQAEREVELVGFRERYKEIRAHIHVHAPEPKARLNNVLFPQIFTRLKAAANTEVKRVPELHYDLGEKKLSMSFRDVTSDADTQRPDGLSSYREIMWVQENIERLEKAMEDAGKKETQRVTETWGQKQSRSTKLSTVLHALEGEPL